MIDSVTLYSSERRATDMLEKNEERKIIDFLAKQGILTKIVFD